jgi:hypothetical protein
VQNIHEKSPTESDLWLGNIIIPVPLVNVTAASVENPATSTLYEHYDEINSLTLFMSYYSSPLCFGQYMFVVEVCIKKGRRVGKKKPQAAFDIRVHRRLEGDGLRSDAISL